MLSKPNTRPNPKKKKILLKHLIIFRKPSSDASKRLIVKQKTIRALLETGSSGDLHFMKGISKIHTYFEEGCATIVGHFKWHLYNKKGG
jgi:hypothetical protein